VSPLTLAESAAYLARHGYTVVRARDGSRGPVQAETLKHWLLRDLEKPISERRFPHAVKDGTGNRGTWHIPQADLDAFLARREGRSGHARPVTIDGVPYPSIAEAARVLKVSRHVIRERRNAGEVP